MWLLLCFLLKAQAPSDFGLRSQRDATLTLHRYVFYVSPHAISLPTKQTRMVTWVHGYATPHSRSSSSRRSSNKQFSLRSIPTSLFLSPTFQHLLVLAAGTGEGELNCGVAKLLPKLGTQGGENKSKAYAAGGVRVKAEGERFHQHNRGLPC